MPEISRFLGIVIKMYYREHPPAHFHAQYGGYEVVVDLGSGEVKGWFPPRSRRHVLEWYDLHRTDLEENWKLAQQGRPLHPIRPLE